MKAARWVVPLAVAIAAALLYAWNRYEAVTLHLGFTTIYRVPLIPLVLGAFLLGMGTMFLIGLRHDREVRRVLQERVSREDRTHVYTAPYSE